MASIDCKRIALIVLGLAMVVALVILVVNTWPTPQMGADEAVFNTVDALFTAVTGRNEQQLGQCEKQLHTFRDAGKLPAAAADHLDSVIGQARAGRWQSAAERLYDFMKGQRREGRGSRRK
jgi:hypothetical protein